MSRTIPDYDFKLKDVSLKSLNIFKKITIDLPITTQASSFTADILNEDGDYNNYFDYHDDVKIYFGYESDGVVGLFHGRVEKLKKNWKKSGSTITISGRGMWTLMLEKFEVKTFSSTELGAIIKDLISNNVTGLTTTNVGNSGITPDSEVVDHTFIQEKVIEYCAKAGFDAWVDFDDDLHYTGTPGANAVSLVAGENIKEIELGIDWKKIRNYIRCYGKKVEDVQLVKTEEDAASQTKYGVVMKIIKDASLDETSLVQSIADAALLEQKEAEWGGMAVIPGDERILPAKSITVTVPDLDVNASYKVRHVKHIFEPKGSGFQTTVMLEQEEAATAEFYKELYEKTGKIVDFANSGNYEESYVYKFTDDQDSLLTLSNCYTLNSTLLLTNPNIDGTCALTTAIIGDSNYSYCLPFVSQEYPKANKFEVSNDGGSTWEQVYHDTEHTFTSATGDKNDFKFKITMSLFDILEIASATTDTIYGLFEDVTSELWSFRIPDKAEEIWGLAYADLNDKLYETENSTGKIYEVNPEDGSAETEKADLAIELGGCAWDGANLYVIDRTNDTISKRNAADFAIEDSNEATPASDPTGLTYDGDVTYPFWVADKGSDSVWKKCNTNEYFPIDKHNIGYRPYDACYNSIDSRLYISTYGSISQLKADLSGVDNQYSVSSWSIAGLCHDGTQFWSCSGDEIFKHNVAAPGTVDNTYTVPGITYTLYSITWDGTYLYVLEASSTGYGLKFHKIDPSDPTTIVATTSMSEQLTVTTIEYYDGKIWFVPRYGGGDYIHYIVFGNTTITSYNTGSVLHSGTSGRRGALAHDGTRFYMYKEWSGVGQYFYEIGILGEWGEVFFVTDPYDLAWDGTDIMVASEDNIYKYDTNGAVVDSFIAPGTSPRGLDFKKDYTWSKIWTFGAYLK